MRIGINPVKISQGSKLRSFTANQKPIVKGDPMKEPISTVLFFSSKDLGEPIKRDIGA